jgi:signal transduction histidine kinase
VDQVPCDVSVDTPPLRLGPETSSNIYRIAQESIRNAIKHSRCSHIRVELQSSGSRLLLTIEDNGIGFARDGRAGGFGLAIMKHRARSIGGTLEIASDKGSGTRVQLSVPLHA